MSAHRAKTGTPVETRLLAWVQHASPAGCWIWEGAKDREGYGRLDVDGKSWRAHRAAYTAFVGPIPEAMTVDHLCFVPSCINPEHLQLLTVSENSRRQRKAFATHCQRDHEWTPENTERTVKGHRRCRACTQMRDRRRYARSHTTTEPGGE